MSKLGQFRGVFPDDPYLLRRNAITLSHCLPANLLTKFVESAALDSLATRAYPPGKQDLCVKDPAHDPLVCKSTTHDPLPV